MVNEAGVAGSVPDRPQTHLQQIVDELSYRDLTSAAQAGIDEESVHQLAVPEQGTRVVGGTEAGQLYDSVLGNLGEGVQESLKSQLSRHGPPCVRKDRRGSPRMSEICLPECVDFSLLTSVGSEQWLFESMDFRPPYLRLHRYGSRRGALAGQSRRPGARANSSTGLLQCVSR